ncbi:MAG: MotA/TolQ/ExbB proton channel family protein [bacterium]
MFDLIGKGGLMMIPIIICSVLALAISVERFLNLKREKVLPQDFITKIKTLLSSKRINEAIAVSSNTDTPMANIIEAGILKRHTQREQIKEAIEMEGKREANFLFRYLGILGTIAGITPLLGLLGTVTGMIKAFATLSAVGAGNPQVLSGGISEALITTAAGLFVAIPTLVIYNYFSKQVKGYVVEMEAVSLELLDILENVSQAETDELLPL